MASSTSTVVQASLTTLPPELIDAILFHIPSPSSLSRLSQSCRTLFAAIVPDHLHYRSLTILSNDLLPFLTLSCNHRLACHVQHLRILGDRPEEGEGRELGKRGYYACVRSDEELTGKWEKRSAAMRLPNLVSLRLEIESPGAFYGLFRRMRTESPGLTDVTVTVIFRIEMLIGEKTLKAARFIAEMGGYQRFSWYSPDTASGHLLKPLTTMLSTRCPALTSLRLSLPTARYTDPTLHPTLLTSHWPHLLTLDLTLRDLPPATLSTFLSSHPNIEELHLRTDGLQSFLLPATALPNLRVFNVVQPSAECLLSILAPPRPLASLAWITLAAMLQKPDEILRALAALEALEALELGWATSSRMTEEQVSSCVADLGKVGAAVGPSLRTLAVSLPGIPSFAIAKQLAQSLCAFPHLTTLRFVGRLVGMPDEYGWADLVPTVGSTCVGLRRVEIPEGVWTKGEDGEWEFERVRGPVRWGAGMPLVGIDI